MTQRSATCGNCGQIIDLPPNDFSQPASPCPRCGSTKQNIKISISEEITVRECLKGKVKDKNYPSKKNPRKEFVIGDEVSKSDGKWMKKERIIDKEKNQYKEVVIDSSTGEIIHSTNEELKKHVGHGSAKFKKG